MSNQTSKTVLRYAGGKSRAIKKITPFVEPYSEIVSPFLGGGSLEVHWASEGKKVIASDVFDILANVLDDRLWDVGSRCLDVNSLTSGTSKVHAQA